MCMLVATPRPEQKILWNIFLVWELIFLCQNITDATAKNRGLMSDSVRNFFLFSAVYL